MVNLLDFLKNVTNLDSMKIRNIFWRQKINREGCTAVQPFSSFFGQERPHRIGRDLKQSFSYLVREKEQRNRLTRIIMEQQTKHTSCKWRSRRALNQLPSNWQKICGGAFLSYCLLVYWYQVIPLCQWPHTDSRQKLLLSNTSASRPGVISP